MRTLLLATKNRGKVREYRDMLVGIPFEVSDLAALGIVEDVEETGRTFEENAILKARHWASKTGLLTLADDSGLEVDILNGDPGVRSARYAGEGAADEERNTMLLQKLHAVPAAQRTARFRCVIAIAEPQGRVATFEGRCEGLIAPAPRGAHGFGYDPVFYLPELGKTMAELPPGEKNQLSHRGRALAKARDALLKWPAT